MELHSEQVFSDSFFLLSNTSLGIRSHLTVLLDISDERCGILWREVEGCGR